MSLDERYPCPTLYIYFSYPDIIEFVLINSCGDISMIREDDLIQRGLHSEVTRRSNLTVALGVADRAKYPLYASL